MLVHFIYQKWKVDKYLETGKKAKWTIKRGWREQQLKSPRSPKVEEEKIEATLGDIGQPNAKGGTWFENMENLF